MTAEKILRVRRALLSVSDKTGLVPFARGLAGLGIALVSSGTTASALREAGVVVTTVSDVTGFPEMLDGRVKTLHPRIHAGILADRRKPAHLEQLREHGIEPFDLVVVNLYPFERAVAAGASFDDAIEQIDIGGPTLVRAAAKNFESVGVVVSPDAYEPVLEEIRATGGLARYARLRLALTAFSHTAGYERAIAGWFEVGQEPPPGDARPDDALPERISTSLTRLASLRYGENPHQRGALYEITGSGGPLGGAEVIQGKEMSFNNWLDAEAAGALAGLFDPDRAAAVIVKHNNPCGVALGDSPAEAYQRALDCDRVSAFGGIVAFNREVDEDAAKAMAEVFTEVVIAPGFAEDALHAYARKRNLRVVKAPLRSPGGLEIRPIHGGALVQDTDTIVETASDMKTVTSAEPTDAQWRDLQFAWKVAARTKSNAIVLATDLATVAIGAGQMNRLTSVDIAARHAGERARGSCLASDAFFPFRDGIDRAGEAGIAAVIQPGGSVRDEEVIAAAEEHGMVMVFTGRRHFRH
jgi:phosphoribosylaminoimidazolecarboxamide formyltransferase / IMP cyclohydrolase